MHGACRTGSAGTWYAEKRASSVRYFLETFRDLIDFGREG
jgi:hypothetical protein